MTEHLSQNRIVLNHLLTGDPIDQDKAREQYQIRRLASRISDLKKEAKEGKCPVVAKYWIKDKMVKTENGKLFKTYWIELPKERQEILL